MNCALASSGLTTNHLTCNGDSSATDRLGESVFNNITVLINDTNDAPVPNAGGPYSINEGETFSLQGSASDQDVGQVLTYQWDLDYDGAAFDVDQVGATPSVLIPDQQSLRTIALRVIDNGSLPQSAITTTTLVVKMLLRY